MVLNLFIIFCAVALFSYSAIPLLFKTTTEVTQKRANILSSKLERVLPRGEVKKVSKIYFMAPGVCAVAGYFLFPEEFRLFGVVLGLVFGFVFPSIYTQNLLRKNRNKFNHQLIDALMIMSSSFRGGLSLIQAMEAVVEEMSDPISQEFATVLGENKMGVSLEEALNHLYKRMPSSGLQQMITAILLARETGGNLPVIFSRIVGTIRETRKIQENLATLTIQGKIQGFVMSMLPIAFAFIVYSTNPRLMENMIASDTGKPLIIYAVISEIIGAYLIWKISTFKDF